LILNSDPHHMSLDDNSCVSNIFFKDMSHDEVKHLCL